MSEQPVKSGRKPNATQIILIVGTVLVLASVAVVGWLLLKGKGDENAVTAAPGAGNVVIDDVNMNDIVAELNRRAAEGMFEVKMNANWTFPNGTSASTDAYVANSAANHRPFYFDVTLEDGTVIYTSPVIPLGSAVEGFSLSQDLDAGTYECVCTFYLLNDDQTVDSTTSVVVRIQVVQ